MNFRLAATGLALFLSSAAANAATVTCDGTYLAYKFHMTAQYSGTQLTSQIKVEISKSGEVVKELMMTPTSSNIQENSSLAAKGTDGENSGDLNASYKGNNIYRGTLYARTTSGSASVTVTCRLK